LLAIGEWWYMEKLMSWARAWSDNRVNAMMRADAVFIMCCGFLIILVVELHRLKHHSL
jgi:hypothetical protein